MNNCLFCNKPLIGWKKTRNKFCSSDCANKFKIKQKELIYLEGNIKEPATLKKYFLKFNKNICSICGLSSWNNKPITLILDHIDGNPNNNLPSNLRLVCPNCDSQLSTYKNRNKGNGRAYRRQRYKEGKSY